MREILFRGKRVDNGEWVGGLPIKTYDTEIGKNSADYANPVPVVLMASGRIVLECGCDDVPFFNIDEYPIVNPETVGQYTGLTDKKGTRIFEGDVLSGHLDDLFPKEESRYEVVWYDYGWHIKSSDGIFDTMEQNWVDMFFEVIGNIHDNPELMGGNTHG